MLTINFSPPYLVTSSKPLTEIRRHLSESEYFTGENASRIFSVQILNSDGTLETEWNGKKGMKEEQKQLEDGRKPLGSEQEDSELGSELL